MLSPSPRPSCPKCVLKHISQACVLFQESLHGYPLHRWLSIGHLAEAEAESQSISPKFASKLRSVRKSCESDDLYIPDCVSLISDFLELIKESNCETCQRAENFESSSLSLEAMISELLTISKESL